MADQHDIPEADAFEQSLEVTDEQIPTQPHLGEEVPEADALEQALVVPLDDEEDPR